MEVMSRKIQILDYTLTAQGYKWQAGRSVWASTARASRRALFSTFGMSTTDTMDIVCHELLPLMQCVQIGDRKAFITEAVIESHQRFRMTAAFADVYACSYITNAGETVAFEGLLTEKYTRYAEVNPYAVTDITCVLVTPKEVEIDHGKVIRIGDHDYHMTVRHLLDPYRNEYEVMRHDEH